MIQLTQRLSSLRVLFRRLQPHSDPLFFYRSSSAMMPIMEFCKSRWELKPGSFRAARRHLKQRRDHRTLMQLYGSQSPSPMPNTLAYNVHGHPPSPRFSSSYSLSAGPVCVNSFDSRFRTVVSVPHGILVPLSHAKRPASRRMSAAAIGGGVQFPSGSSGLTRCAAPAPACPQSWR